MGTESRDGEFGVELFENLDEYSICETCNFNFGPILIKKNNFESHLNSVHHNSEQEQGQSMCKLEKNDENTLHKYYNLSNIIKLRKETNIDKQKEYYEVNGRDVSLIEITETLRAAIKLFLSAYKKKIACLQYPNVQILNLTEDQLNQLLSLNHGVYFFYSLINIGDVRDITVQSLIARSWDWSEEDQDLRKDIDFIKSNVINDAKHPHYKEANECINMGYLVLLTMTEAVKHLLLLSYLTKTIFKKQD
ncbi:hypothetical protein FG379_001470 [Cryptosporidium bovis]|uniref:uncharacterized protein n=1 Tax=Cryptosporidium bovis TaxID=310047 RepID=UPI00351A3669|nr:hypothetical protein FG379_001470 [Cryptosporidium bovis]